MIFASSAQRRSELFKVFSSLTNINRQFQKSFIVTALCAALVCFLSLYIGNIQSNQVLLSTLPQTIPVTAFISDLSGSMNIGLQINGSIIDEIEASGLVSDMVCTVQAAANFAPETPEERIKPKKIKLSGVNALIAYPSVQPSSGEPDFLNGQSAYCIANRYFMENYGLTVGDEIELDIYRHSYTSNMLGTLRYEYLAENSLKIADSFDSQASAEMTITPDIIVPIGWLKSVYNDNGVDFYADSVSFSVKDPMELNKFKAAMKELKLLPVNPQAAVTVAGSALVVNDETFIRSATSLKNNLLTLSLFLPLLITAVLASGYVVSNLMFQSRSVEYAVMRSLGMGKAACLAVFLFESAILALSGGLIGALMAALLAGANIVVIAVSVASFFAAYMLGVLTAVYALGRVGVINALTKAD